MARTRRTIQRYIQICEAYHAGFDLASIKELLGSRITSLEVEAALDWERDQVLVRSEIQSVYDALLATRDLRKKANLILDTQYYSVTAKTRRFAIKDVQELIDAELRYSDRLRELAGEVDNVQEHVGLASLPAGIFSEDLEPESGDGDS